MATYREIHGKAIKSLSTDPSATTDEGQIWYNTASNTFKSIVNLEAWISGASLTTARQALGGIGTQTANLAVGGYVSAESTLVEEYNGSGWATGGALPAAKNSGGGFGTQTAGVYAGGGLSPNSTATNTSQEYNGTSWTASPGNLNTTRDQTAGAGIETAGLCCGGTPNGSAETNTSEEYNGSTWTAGNNLNFAARSVNNNSLGIQTAALLVGGNSSGATSGVQTYDGTNWTTTTSLPEARISLATSGTQTAGLAFGGNDGSNIENTNLQFDGSSWTAGPTMGTARDGLGGSPSGTSSAAVASGGRQPGPANSSLTEEFTSSANVITAGAWASGGNLNTARYSLGGFGTATAGVAMCGRDSPIYQATEEYDGSSWTTVNNYPQTVNDLGSTGILTAGLGLGGLNPPSIPSFPTTGRVTGEYDGTNWTTGGSYTYDAWGTQCAGTQTATVAGGGHNYPMPPGNISSSAEYDGSSWTAGNSMSQARAMFGCSGTQTAGLFTGGRSSPGVEDPTNKTEEYDGTNWTSGGNYVISVKENTQGGGPQTAAYMAGGSAPPYTTVAGHYDGTAWATAPSLPTVKGLGNAASNTADNTTGLVFGGAGPSTTNTTFDFTAETSAINVKTLTQS